MPSNRKWRQTAIDVRVLRARSWASVERVRVSPVFPVIGCRPRVYLRLPMNTIAAEVMLACELHRLSDMMMVLRLFGTDDELLGSVRCACEMQSMNND